MGVVQDPCRPSLDGRTLVWKLRKHQKGAPGRFVPARGSFGVQGPRPRSLPSLQQNKERRVLQTAKTSKLEKDWGRLDPT